MGLLVGADNTPAVPPPEAPRRLPRWPQRLARRLRWISLVTVWSWERCLNRAPGRPKPD